MERNLEVVWFRHSRSGALLSGTSGVRLVVAPNRSGRVRLGIHEEYVGGTGRVWRSSVWLAAFVATTLADRNLSDFSFELSIDGFIDGPSAGGLISVGFLSALTGARLRPTLTMTGALSPDGSLSEVSQIEAKIAAAAKAGKSTLLVPFVADAAKLLLWKKRARDLGIRVVPVRDVREAYALMTGSALREPEPVAPREMAIGKETQRHLVNRARGLLDDVEISAQVAGPRNLPHVPTARAGLQHDRARLLLARHHVAAGYLAAVEASAQARAAADQRLSLSAHELSLEIARTKSSLMEMRRQHTLRPGAHAIDVLSANAALSRAYALLSVATTLDGKDERGRSHRALNLRRAQLAMEESSAFEGAEANAACVARRWRSTARSYSSGAAAALRYLEGLILPSIGKVAQVPFATARASLALQEPSYVGALALNSLSLSSLRKPLVDGALFSQAASIGALHATALLIAKLYDLPGTPERPRRSRLGLLVDNADRWARLEAARAKEKLSEIPTLARLYYSAGAVLKRDPSRKRRLRALGHLWHSALLSRLAHSTLVRGECRNDARSSAR